MQTINGEASSPSSPSKVTSPFTTKDWRQLEEKMRVWVVQEGFWEVIAGLDFQRVVGVYQAKSRSLNLEI